MLSLFLMLGSNGYAQLCTGSLGDPIDNVTFGSGLATHGPALPAGLTNYTHTNDNFPQDGSYTIANTTAGAGNVWWTTTDHTGNVGGYMMIVNANIAPTDYFYRRTITGLCSGTTFEFAAWVVNLLRTRDDSPPNLTFAILSTVDGRILHQYNTGAIPLTTSGPVWKRVGTTFTMPAAENSVVLQITNNTVGARPGNDLALDDITFSPCGPLLTSAISSHANSIAQNVCIGDPGQSYVLNAYVVAGGYTNPIYQWQQNSGSGWTNIVGQTSTTYAFTFQPTAAGLYQYRLVSAEAANGIGSVCKVASNVLSINVAAGAAASFTYAYDPSTCLLRNVVQFTDTSTPNGAPITSWRWDFGDGETDNTRNPTHTYRNYGVYTVTLTVSSNATCSSTSAPQSISTNPTMRPAFDIDANICPGVPVTVTDRSQSERVVKYWLVNWGDGINETYDNNANWTHVYQKTGRYTISLSLRSVSPTDCYSDVVQKTVDVTAVSFAVCQSEVTQFTDQTDPTGTFGMTYNWDFGDAAGSSVENPNTSTLKNPTHKYNTPGSYNVRLRVRSPNGCTDAEHVQTVVIPTEPVANFDIVNRTNLCGLDSVAFVDKTDTLTVRRVVWFYDVVNRPTDSLNITRFLRRSDRTYKHLYPINYTTAPITYKARMIARRLGQTCPDPTLTMDVVIYPTPVVTPRVNGSTFTGSYALCTGANAVTLTATANIPGSAVFTGRGIVNGNSFDPSVSGIGTFVITCVYTGNNTPCISTTTFNIIVGSPVVTLPATVGVLEGKATQLNPNVTGTGSNLAFLWSPATGISDPTVRNPVFTPTQDTRYTLTVTSGGGCSVSATVMVNVLKTPVVPNAFTPNNDGINDTWTIQYISTYPGATVDVFSRNGVKVFSSVGYPRPWDGTTNGSPLPVGTYYYVINPRSGRAAMSGSLTIIR